MNGLTDLIKDLEILNGKIQEFIPDEFKLSENITDYQKHEHQLFKCGNFIVNFYQLDLREKYSGCNEEQFMKYFEQVFLFAQTIEYAIEDKDVSQLHVAIHPEYHKEKVKNKIELIIEDIEKNIIS